MADATVARRACEPSPRSCAGQAFQEIATAGGGRRGAPPLPFPAARASRVPVLVPARLSKRSRRRGAPLRGVVAGSVSPAREFMRPKQSDRERLVVVSSL